MNDAQRVDAYKLFIKDLKNRIFDQNSNDHNKIESTKELINFFGY